MSTILSNKYLNVSVDNVSILKNINLTMQKGEIHAIMGPNGSGKSTFAYTLMGHPYYTVDSGSVIFDNEDVTQLSVDQRAKKGLFLAFQQPPEIPGVSVFTFLKETCRAVKGTSFLLDTFQEMVTKRMQQLKIDPVFLYRNLNDGFSGGEKKRFEMLQLLLLNPKLVILDEIDSGLDVDALKIVSHGLVKAKKENPHLSILLITHYHRILNYISPDVVHVFYDGFLVDSGGPHLAASLEKEGYNGYRKTAK